MGGVGAHECWRAASLLALAATSGSMACAAPGNTAPEVRLSPNGRPAAATGMAHDCPAGQADTRVGDVPVCAEELAFSNDGLSLGGRLLTPRDASEVGSRPAVVLVPGSGPSQRGHPWTDLLAAAFLRQRLSVLIPDKRGSDASEGDWRSATYADLAGDAGAAVARLRAHPGIDPARVGVAGLSEGGQVVAIVAAYDRGLAFVVNVVGGAVPFVPKVRYEVENSFREAGLEGARLDAAQRVLSAAAAYVLGEIPWEEYASVLDAARPTLGPDADRFFMGSPDHWRWAFLRAHRDWDPVPFWEAVTSPVLVLYGAEDRNQPSRESAARLQSAFTRTGHDDAVVRVFPGLGHSLRSGPMGPLDPAVERTLGKWLTARIRRE